jgi:hypothetical protein
MVPVSCLGRLAPNASGSTLFVNPIIVMPGSGLGISLAHPLWPAPFEFTWAGNYVTSVGLCG